MISFFPIESLRIPEVDVARLEEGTGAGKRAPDDKEHCAASASERRNAMENLRFFRAPARYRNRW
jgi:hypothetical protein